MSGVLVSYMYDSEGIRLKISMSSSMHSWYTCTSTPCKLSQHFWSPHTHKHTLSLYQSETDNNFIIIWPVDMGKASLRHPRKISRSSSQPRRKGKALERALRMVYWGRALIWKYHPQLPCQYFEPLNAVNTATKLVHQDWHSTHATWLQITKTNMQTTTSESQEWNAAHLTESLG